MRRARERLNRDSTSSLSRLRLNKNFTADDVAHAANEGDDFALMMIERTGKYIGTGVATVINLLNIERIVLGGGVMDAGALILNPIIQEVKRRAFLRCLKPPRSSPRSLARTPLPSASHFSPATPLSNLFHADLTQFENLDLFGKVKALCNKHSECERFVRLLLSPSC